MKIDGRNVPFLFEESIIDAATRAGIYIPTLCNDVTFIDVEACCRLCMVEVTQNGKRRIVAACETEAENNMEISTTSASVQKARKTVLQLMYTEAPDNETIMNLMKRYEVGPDHKLPLKNERPCIHCLRCINACKFWFKGALGSAGRGINVKIDTPFGQPSCDCSGCATCQMICPIDVVESDDCEGKRNIWHKDFELIYCEECGKLLTTKEHFNRAYYKDAPVLCYDCSELYRKKHRISKHIFDV